jgi:hypothetical protein
MHKRRQGIAYTQCTLRHDEYEHKSPRFCSDFTQVALNLMALRPTCS